MLARHGRQTSDCAHRALAVRQGASFIAESAALRPLPATTIKAIGKGHV